MNISYKWLKEYVDFDLTAQEVCDALTSTGLEVDALEEVQSIKGGLKGLYVGKVLTYGAQKYSDNSWQNLPDFWKRYKAALLRHLTAIDKGELIDPESGLPHIDHVLCNTVFLDWGFHHGKAISINTKDIEQDE